ncbi:MAG: TonB family protein [Verrucomicrobia bacterium]|nr:TonB family protein [Verrucomicrobiota bacterium]
MSQSERSFQINRAMGRLQKKCMMVSAGVHVALVLVLLLGPAFRTAPEKPKRASQLNLLSAVAIEAALSQAAQKDSIPAEPKPVVQERPEPPTLVQEKPKPTPPKKVEPPKPTPVEQPKPKVEPKVVPKPAPKPKPPVVKPKPKLKPKINFNTKTPKADPAREKREAASRARKRELETQRKNAAKRQREMNEALDSLGNNLNQRLDINANLVGGSALGNYRLWVRTAFNKAWVQPSGGGNSRSATRVRVVVNLDGTVASATVVGASGNRGLDQSVRDALKRVKRIQRRPPAETTTAERTFIINFNLKDGRISG